MESGGPFESGHFGELGYDLDMPVVLRHLSLMQRSGVDDEIVGGMLERLIEFAQCAAQHPGQVLERGSVAVFEMGVVALGEYPGLEGKSRGIGAEYDEVIRLGHQARAAAQLLADDIAKDASLFEIEVGFGALDLLANALGNHRKRDQLRMAVL